MSRIACAVLALASTVAGQHHHDAIELRHLGFYPGYEGHPIEGEVTLYFHGDTNVSIAYNLHGVEDACKTPNASAPNSCGIHIHEGSSCKTASAPGGHFYNHSTFSSDPWAHVVYDVYHSGHVEAEFGYGMREAEGKTFVVHNHAGARVTCAVIPNHHE